MPTIIDSLIVTLALDPTKFTKGQKDAANSLLKTKEQAQQTAKDMETQGKKASAFYSQIRNEVIGLFAAFTAGKGLTEFVSSITKGDSATGRLATNIGITTEKLSAWQQAAEQTGGSAEGIAGSMQNLSQQLQQLTMTGQSGVVPYFRALGVSLTDASGKAKSMDQIYLDLADKLKDMDPARAQFFGRGMGIDPNSINLLRHGRSAVEGLIAEQEKFGKLTKEDTEAAQARSKAMRQLTAASEDLGRKILTALTPHILDLINALTRLAEWGHQHRAIVEATFLALAAAVTAFGAATTAGMVSGLLGMAAAGTKAALSLGGLAMILGKLVVMFTAVNAAISAFDPNDKMGAWIDRHIPGASFIDNMASKIGLGRSYAEQAEADKLLGPSTDPSRSQKIFHSGGHSGTPRGIRNNNPGNLNFAGQDGASSDGRFAVFPTMAQGVAASAHQLRLYSARGINTVRGIISKWAPSSENNTAAYIASVAKRLGVDPNQPLNLNDPNTMRGLLSGITTMENGAGRVSMNDINAGLAMGAGGAINSSVSSNRNTSNTNTSHTQIGSIAIQTQATDANGIAQDIGKRLENYSFVSQSNYSLV